MWLSLGWSPCSTAAGQYPSEQLYKRACAESLWEQGSQGPPPPSTSHTCLWHYIYVFWPVVSAWLLEWPQGKSLAWIRNYFAGPELRFSTGLLLLECLCAFLYLLGLCFSSVELDFELSVAFKWMHLKIDFHRKHHLFYYAWHTFI